MKILKIFEEVVYPDKGTKRFHDRISLYSMDNRREKGSFSRFLTKFLLKNSKSTLLEEIAMTFTQKAVLDFYTMVIRDKNLKFSEFGMYKNNETFE